MTSAIAPRFNLFSGSRALVPPKRAPIYVHLPLVEQLAKKTLIRVRHPAGSNLAGKTVIALSATDLSAAFTRHILQIIPSVGPHHPAVSGLGCVSSSIGLLVGTGVLVGNGIADLNKSNQIGDREGMRRAGTQITSGTVLTTASALSLAYHASTVTISGVAIAADVFYGLGSLIGMGVAGWGIYRSSLFRSRMNGHLESKNLSEKERMIKALEFLKEKISPTAKEKEAIVKEVERLHPKWDSSQKLIEVRRKLYDLAEVKVRYVKRRTDQKTAERVLVEVNKHLGRLRGGGDWKALNEAKNLIRKVMNHNMKNILIDTLIGGASLIAFVAVVLGSFFSLGGLPFLLYAISTAIALGLLLFPLIADLLRKSQSNAMQSNAIALTPVTVVTSGSN